jgi:hypothetical protein
MKNILSALIAVSAVAVFASTAHADSGTSTHTGDVAGTCTLAVADGELPTGVGLTNVIQSSTLGTVATVCNTTASELAVVLGTGSYPAQDNYTQKFTVTGVDGAYSGVTATDVTTYEQSDLSNAFSAATSNLTLSAKGEVPVAQNLAAGIYTIVLDVTVTP